MQDVKINIKADDSGSIGNLAKDAVNLANQLKKAAKEASAIRVPNATAAARQGVAASAGRPDTDAFGIARGVGGATGAASRDFAKQAQGLGGLVGVYATFAANIFAVSAAFTALSKAADTTNLIAGLDQLGAASGKNLGSLGKELVRVTDGALSLAEGLRSVANASAGGLSNDNILRLGKVAKSASQALGVDLPDAVNRLTRGITKLEPELLDEIGIMVRLDDATAAYAKTVGKSALALTDFERRQAFANAVLDQGEKKFGAIDLAANPYTKVLASLKDLTQTTLEGVNKVLGPIVEILASSPTALAAAVGGFALILLKQAIPALSAWRAGLDAAEEKAREAALSANKLRNEQREALFSSRIVEPVVAREAAAEAATMSAVASARKIENVSDKTRKVLAFNVKTATATELAELEKQAAAREKYSKRADAISKGYADRAAREAIALRAVTAALKEQIAAREAADAMEAAAGRVERPGLFSTIRQDEITRQRLEAVAARKAVVKGAVDEGAVLGFGAGMRALIEDTKKAGKATDDGFKGLNRFNQALALTQGTALLAVQGISRVTSALFGVFAAIGVGVAVFQILDSLLSKNTKQVAAFETSLDTLDSAVDNLQETLKRIASKDPLEAFNIESTQARANAINELNLSLAKTNETFNEAIRSAGAWDKLFDNIFDIFGAGLGDKYANTLGRIVNETLLDIDSDATRKTLSDSLKTIINVDPSNMEAFTDAFKDLNDTQKAFKGREIVKLFSDFQKSTIDGAANLTTFKASLKETSDLVQTTNAKLKGTDTESQFGSTLINQANSLNMALKTPIEGLKALGALAGDINTLSLLPPDLALQLGTAKSGIDAIAKSYETARLGAQKARKDIAALNVQVGSVDSMDAQSRAASGFSGPQQSAAKQQAREDLKTAEEFLAYSQSQMEKAKKDAAERVAIFEQAGNKIFAQGIERLGKALSQAMESASINFGTSLNAIMKSAGAVTSKSDSEFKLREIKVQIEQIDSLYENSRSLNALRISVERSNLIQDRILAQQALDKMTGGGDGTIRNSLQEKIANIDRALESNVNTAAFLQKSSKEILELGRKSAAGRASPEEQAIAQSLSSYIQELFGRDSKLANLLGQLQIGKLQDRIALFSQAIDRANRDLATKGIEAAGVLKAAQTTQAASGGFFVESDAKAVREAALEQQRIANEQKLNQLAKDKNIIEETGRELAKKKLKDSDEQIIANKEAAKDIAEAERVAAKENARLRKEIEDSFINSRTQGLNKLTELEASRLALIKNLTTSQRESEEELSEARLDSAEKLGTMTALEILAVRTKQALVKETYEYEAREAAALAEFRARTAADYAILDNTASSEASQKQAAARILEEANLYARVSQGAKDILGTRQKILGITSSQKGQDILATNELRKQEAIMSKMGDIANSLAAVFGELGEAIGGMTLAFTSFATTQKKLDDDIAAKRKEQSLSDEARLQAENDYIMQSSKNRLEATEKGLSASKKLFKEDSTGYKAITNLEKANHIVKMANLAKELFYTIFVKKAEVVASTTAASAKVAADSVEIGSSMSKLSVNAAESVTKQTASGDPYTAIPRGIAMAAFVGAILASVGAKKPAVPGGFSAESRQEVQGTGQSFVGGNLVSNGAGALGDPTAKSEAVANSLDFIEQYSFKNLEFSNKMLDALKNIEKNTQQLAADFIRIGGITGNTGKTSEGSNVPSFVKALTPAGLADSLGIGLGAVGKATDKLLSAVFGKTTQSVKDTGIQLSGTLGQASQGQGTLQSFTNIETTKKRLGRTKTSFSTELQDISDSAANETIASLFSSIIDGLSEAGNVLGKQGTREFISALNVSENFKISGKDLKGDEFAEAILAQIGIEMDLVAAKAFPELENFRKLGESLSETVVRVARQSELVSLALTSIGTAITITATTIPDGFVGPVNAAENFKFRMAQISDELIEAAGGLDEFLDKTEYFRDNFLTDAQRLAPVQASLAKEMEKLNLVGIDSREEFADVVKALDLTTVGGRDTYVSMLNLAEAFAEVYPETRKMISEEEKLSQQRSKYLEVLRLEGRMTEALSLARELELAELDPSLRTIQEYIYALEDQTKLVKMEVDLLSALGASYEVLTANRALELRTLTDSERIIKQQIYAAQDKQKTDDLLLELLEASGNSSEVVAKKRQAELKGLSVTDAALKARIYQLQDEAKLLEARKTQETAIYELLGQSEKSLAAARAKELEALDEQLRSVQVYIFALQDEKALKDKLAETYTAEADALKNTISTLKGSISTLKEFRNSLVLSESSILTPKEKYDKLKSDAQEVAAIAMGIATTDAEKEAKEAAINKLPEISSAFLEVSRTLYASSGQYTQDFNTILSTLDATSSALDKQLTDTEKQLLELEASVALLDIIKTNTQTTASVLQQMYEAQAATAAAKEAAGISSTGALPGVSVELIAREAISTEIESLFTSIMSRVTDPELGLVRPNLDITPIIQNNNQNTAAMILELKALKDEVVKLRAEQEAQTAALVNTTFDATVEAANIINQANLEVSTNTMWRDRTSVAVM